MAKEVGKGWGNGGDLEWEKNRRIAKGARQDCLKERKISFIQFFSRTEAHICSSLISPPPILTRVICPSTV